MDKYTHHINLGVGARPPGTEATTEKPPKMFHVEHFSEDFKPVVEAINGLTGTLAIISDVQIVELIAAMHTANVIQRTNSDVLIAAMAKDREQMVQHLAWLKEIRADEYDAASTAVADRARKDAEFIAALKAANIEPHPQLPPQVFVEASTPELKRDPWLIGFCAIQTAALVLLIYMLLRGYTTH